MNAGKLGIWWEQARASFRRRPPRERVALSILIWTVIAAIGIQVVWTVENHRRALQRQLPTLADRAERMKHLAQNWRKLSANGAVTRAPRIENARAAIERRLGELGSGIEVQWAMNGELALKGVVDFSTWVRWTATMHEEQRLTLAHCRLQSATNGVALDASYTLPQVLQ